MEVRRVQLTGGASYSVVLPKAWVKSQNIKKNDPLGMVVQSDGTLLLTPKIVEAQPYREKTFDVDAIEEPTYLFRCLIGAYVTGYTTIVLRARSRVPSFVRAVVRNFTQMTIGQEVVKETNNTIVIKDLLNPAEMPFTSTISRMYIIVKNMHEDAIMALRDRNNALAENVIAMDNDVDRLHWLVARQHSILHKDHILGRKMSVGPEMAANYFLASRIIERIGDHAVRIAKNVKNIIGDDVGDKIESAIFSASSFSLKIFDKSMEAFLRKNMALANEAIEAVAHLARMCEKINTLALKQKGETVISIGYIAESIRRTAEYSGDLAEVVIDYLV